MSGVVERTVDGVLKGRGVSAGDGVKLRRWDGLSNPKFSPFLMINELNSSTPDDFIGGFPMHAHRGIETLTYLRHGNFKHEDHLGNVSEVSSGGVQWMSADRGILHSEMPAMDHGRLHGFQIWINQPAASKMNPAKYLECHPHMIPELTSRDMGLIRVLAGSVTVNGNTLHGPVRDTAVPLSVSDWRASEAGQRLVIPTKADVMSPQQMMVFCYAGAVNVGGKLVRGGELAFLTSGDRATLIAVDGDATATGGDVTATGGDATATDGDATATGGDVTATGGDATATDGDATATSCDVTATGGDVTATSCEVTAVNTGYAIGGPCVCEVLIFSGQVIAEPIAHSGNFVMNTMAEIEQAYKDYRSGVFNTYV